MVGEKKPKRNILKIAGQKVNKPKEKRKRLMLLCIHEKGGTSGRKTAE